MTFDEFKENLKVYIGDRDDDETLSLLESMDSVEIPTQEDALNQLKEELSAAVAEKEAEWRKRYRDRFFGIDTETVSDPEPDVTELDDPEPMTAQDAANLWLEQNGKKYQ